MTDSSIQQRAADQVAAYGRGLLVEDGDLVLADGVLAEVDGLANLMQGLRLRILTPWASDPLDVTYGLDLRNALTTPLTRPLTQDLVRLNLIRTLSGDPRVAEVVDVTFEDDPGAERRRSAVAEITVEPAPLRPATTGAASVQAAALSGVDPSLVTLLADVTW